MFTRRTTFKAVTSVTVAVVLAATPLFGALEESQQPQPCASCGDAPGISTLLGSAASVVQDSVPLTLLPATATPHEGAPVHYVQSATGQVAFSVTDIEFQCQLPVMLTRYYNSGRSGVQSGLGAGWSLIFDDQVDVDGTAARLRSGTGETLDMKLDSARTAFEPVNRGSTYHRPLRSAGNGSLREQMGDVTRVFTADGNVYRLTSVEYGELGSLQISRDRRGKITRLAASDQTCAIDLAWSAGAQPRLLSAADNTGRTVTYVYDRHQLAGVMDVAGAQWRYLYDASGPLGRVVDPEGSAALRVTYAGGRAQTSETIEGSAQFSYQQDGASLNTTVTSAEGDVTIVHNEFGQLASVKSKTGGATTFTYDGGRRLVAVSGPGVRQRFGYDAQDRRILSDVNGRVTRWAYDSAGRVVRRSDDTNWINFSYPDKQTVIASSPVARLNATSTFESGRLVRTTSAIGEETFTYDKLGRLATYGDRSVQLTFQNDAHGWLQRLVMPDGSGVNYTFDARGAVTGTRESGGRTLKYERDRRGALVAVTSSDGGWVKATRDKSGRIVQLTNSQQQSRLFSYDTSGRLATYTNGIGQVFRMRYDRQGAPLRLEQEAGTRVIAKTFGAATRRANSGTQVRSTNLDVDDWYDPDNPEGLLGSFERIRGARITGKRGQGASPESTPAAGGPAPAESLDGLLCSANDCADCKARELQICQNNSNGCRIQAGTAYTACGAVCRNLPSWQAKLICFGICTTAYLGMLTNCSIQFSSCKSGIATRCYAPCKVT